jgi:hypothetical protein
MRDPQSSHGNAVKRESESPLYHGSTQSQGPDFGVAKFFSHQNTVCTDINNITYGIETTDCRYFLSR